MIFVSHITHGNVLSQSGTIVQLAQQLPYGAVTFWIGGGFQVPSRIEGGVSFGQ